MKGSGKKTAPPTAKYATCEFPSTVNFLQEVFYYQQQVHIPFSLSVFLLPLKNTNRIENSVTLPVLVYVVLVTEHTVSFSDALPHW